MFFKTSHAHKQLSMCSACVACVPGTRAGSPNRSPPAAVALLGHIYYCLGDVHAVIADSLQVSEEVKV